jgi:hypothetical protein
MFEKEKIIKIIGMLKMLTDSGEMLWKADGALFICSFGDDLYEIDPLIFTINGALVCPLLVSKESMEFYSYLCNKIVGESIMDKLDRACESKFLS